jgi:hypothetical protein
MGLMPKSQYPVAADLVDLLASGSLTVTTPRATNAILAGIDQFEGEVQRHMLAGVNTDNSVRGTAGVETKTFDPPASGLLQLGSAGGLAEIASVVYAPPSSSPTTWTLGTDYVPQPETGPPYTSLRVVRRWWDPEPFGLQRSVQVSGKWGYGLSIPDAAWWAMLVAGAMKLIPMVGAGRFKGVKSFSEAGTSVTFGYDVKGWSDDYDRAVKVYSRWGI